MYKPQVTPKFRRINNTSVNCILHSFIPHFLPGFEGLEERTGGVIVGGNLDGESEYSEDRKRNGFVENRKRSQGDDPSHEDDHHGSLAGKQRRRSHNTSSSSSPVVLGSKLKLYD